MMCYDTHMAEERLLTVKEVALRARVNEDTVRRWLRTGHLRGRLIGGTRSGYRIPESEVDRVLLGNDQDLKIAA